MTGKVNHEDGVLVENGREEVIEELVASVGELSEAERIVAWGPCTWYQLLDETPCGPTNSCRVLCYDSKILEKDRCRYTAKKDRAI